jgi:hypothetical protein
MASTSEVGHAKNVANFQDLIAFVDGYGATYNPTKNSLKLPQLNTLLADSQSSLQNVVDKNTEYNNAVNDRVATFDGLRSLSTRLVNALEITDASKEKIDDAKGFNRKLQGKRASKIEQPVDPNQPAPKTISSSQQSYDQLIQHFEGLISVLESEPSYAPNEEDLKVTALNAKANALKANNNKVAVAYTGISNSRIDRNKALYKDDSGLVDIATEVKKYIKSIFGATSPEFGQVKGIAFKKIKS